MKEKQPFKLNKEKLKEFLSKAKKDTSWKDKAKKRTNNDCSAMDNWYELHG